MSRGTPVRKNIPSSQDDAFELSLDVLTRPEPVVNVHIPVPVRPCDPVYTDKLGNSYLVDSTTGVPLLLPKADKNSVNGLLALELMRVDEKTGNLNIVEILQNLVSMSKQKGKTGLDAANSVLDRVLGKPVQETKNLNANVNAQSLDELLDMVGPKNDRPQQNGYGPAPTSSCDASPDVRGDVS